MHRFLRVAVVSLFAVCSLWFPFVQAHAASDVLQVAHSSTTTKNVSRCAWDEYQWVDGVTTAHKICLTGYALRDGLKPDGYIVYRKDPGKKSYKKIAVVRKAKWLMNYTDRKVKFSKQYYSYKFKAYRTIDGKKRYGKASSAVKMRAINRTGNCNVSFLTERGSMTSHIDMKLYSSKYNGKIVFTQPAEYFCDARTGNSDDDVEVNLRITEVSSDGKTWKKAPKKVNVSPGETKYLRLTAQGVDSFLFDPNDNDADLSFNRMTYNGFTSYLALSFSGTKALAVIDGEYYH